MKLLQAAKPVRVHPEVREQFHELLRFHFAAHRKSKDAHAIRQEMHKRDTAEQAALLKGNCEMDIVTTHEQSCDSRTGGFMWSLPCDCTPTRSVVFREPVKRPDGLTFLNPFFYTPWGTYPHERGSAPDGGYDAKDEEPE